MEKNSLRKEYLGIRRNIRDKDVKSKEIFKRIIEEDILKYNLYLCYYSLEDEVDTTNLIEYLLSNGFRVALPKVEGKDIKFYVIDSLMDVREGTFKVMEPITNELVVDFSNSICFVPGICFDYYGYRVGYGKGFYDRFLEHYVGDTVGLCFRECVVPKIDHDEYDRCVDRIFTEEKVLIKKRTN